MIFKLFFEHAIFLCFLSFHFLYFLNFNYFMVEYYGLFHILANILPPIHHSWTFHMHFNLSYFHFQKIGPFSIYIRKCNCSMEKKIKKIYNKPKHQNLLYNLKCKHLQKKITNYSWKTLQHMQIKNDYVTMNVVFSFFIIAKQITKLLLNNPKINPLQK